MKRQRRGLMGKEGEGRRRGRIAALPRKGLASEALDEAPDCRNGDEDSRNGQNRRQVAADDGLKVSAQAGNSRGKGGADGLHGGDTSFHVNHPLTGDKAADEPQQTEYAKCQQP